MYSFYYCFFFFFAKHFWTANVAWKVLYKQSLLCYQSYFIFGFCFVCDDCSGNKGSVPACHFSCLKYWFSDSEYLKQSQGTWVCHKGKKKSAHVPTIQYASWVYSLKTPSSMQNFREFSVFLETECSIDCTKSRDEILISAFPISIFISIPFRKLMNTLVPQIWRAAWCVIPSAGNFNTRDDCV